jgi:hypothetical protein
MRRFTVFFVLVLTLSACGSDEPPRPLTRTEQIGRHFSAWDGSHRNLTALIKESMNDPRSFEHDRTTYRDAGDHLVVQTRFRGKNAFGGTVLNQVTARVDLDGNVLEIMSQGPAR